MALEQEEAAAAIDSYFEFKLAHLFLIFDIFLAVLAACSLIGNGFILALIVSRPSLRKNESIYLLTALSLADFMLAFMVVPYITLLITEWSVNLDYPALQMVLFVLPVIGEIKINLVLTFAIAFDRFTALQWPIEYKLKKKGRYTVIFFLIGSVWAVFDVTFLFLTTTIKSAPGCATGGCFLSRTFRIYWGTSNMFISLTAMAVTMLVLMKIRYMRSRANSITPQSVESSGVIEKMLSLITNIFTLVGMKVEDPVAVESVNIARSSDIEQEKFSRANRVAISVLLCSGFCILLPSIFAGVVELFGLRAYQYAGPFVTVGLLLCGFVNTFIYALAHKDIRHAIRVLGVRTVSVSRTESNAGLNFPQRGGVADDAYVIQALRQMQLDARDTGHQRLSRNRTSNASDHITEWFI